MTDPDRPILTSTKRTLVDTSTNLEDSARSYAEASKSARTLREYRSDWTRFLAWCGTEGLSPLPAEPRTVALFLCARADRGRKVSTIQRNLAAICEAHRLAGFSSPRSDPAVRAVLQGIRRRLGVAPVQKAPLLVNDLRRAVESLPDSLIGKRDRLLLLLGFAGAFRRSELVSLDVDDIKVTENGVEVRLRRSKTDQEGKGMLKGIPYGSNLVTCPVRAYRAWVEAAAIENGPVFRRLDRHGNLLPGRLSGRGVARVVKRAVSAAGLDPDCFSGHSLRAGLATSAARAGKTDRVIMRQTGHRSRATLDRYVREADLFRENAASGIGL
ncbi:MAG: site-specific integrase [Planctomycetota bacterium]